MIRQTLSLAAAVLLTAALVFAQSEKKPVKVSGYLIDNMCASHGASAEDAKEHETSCALMPACSKGGFTVVSSDASYKLDAQGNKLAAAALKSTKTKKGLKVEVEGTLDGDTLHVDHLAEVY